MVDDTSRTNQPSGTTTSSSPASRPGLIRSIAHRLAGEPLALPVEGQLASFEGATGWLNSERLTPEGLRGRVVLVDFWTYTCVNWLRTLPYVRAWAAKYADAGLTIVGVHTPEFGFEHDHDNVVAAVRAFRVDYPVALDNDYGVWRAFSNHFWPAAYIADVDGRLRHHHFGEGEYAAIEMVIQQLLMDAGVDDVGQDLVDVDPSDSRWPPTGGRWSRRRRTPGTARARLRAGRPRRIRRALRLRRARAVAAQLLGARRHLDGCPARRRGERARRTDRVPVPRPRPQPGHGTGDPGCVRPVPGLPRRPARAGRSRERHRLRWGRDRRRPADLSAHPPARTDRRASVRDRVPRRGRGGVLLHVRLRSAELSPVASSGRRATSSASARSAWATSTGLPFCSWRVRARSTASIAASQRPDRHRTSARSSLARAWKVRKSVPSKASTAAATSRSASSCRPWPARTRPSTPSAIARIQPPPVDGLFRRALGKDRLARGHRCVRQERREHEARPTGALGDVQARPQRLDGGGGVARHQLDVGDDLGQDRGLV